MILLLSLAALALDADTYKPAGSSPDLQGGLQVMSPTLGWANSAYAGLGLVYAHNPIVRVYTDGTREVILSDTFATRLGAGYNIGGKVRIDLDVPLYPVVAAADATRSGFAAGDIRLDAVIPVLARTEESIFALAVVPKLSFPTGNASKYMGTGTVGAGLAVAARLELQKLFIDGNVGAMAAGQSELGELQFGSGLDLGLGAGYHVAEAWTVGSGRTTRTRSSCTPTAPTAVRAA
jgi:hypothetical protein